MPDTARLINATHSTHSTLMETKTLKKTLLLSMLLALALACVACSSTKTIPVKAPTARQQASFKPGKVIKGVASWYGKAFHGKLTASGEVYDMYALTAAHRTMPLGSILRVKNLKNNRKVEVVVTDRGPYIKGRILDLSYGAAKRLDMVVDGTTNVRIKVLGRDQKYVRYIRFDKSAKPSGRGGGVGGKAVRGPFTVQLGAFTDKSNAERLKTGVGWNHKGVYVAKTRVKGKTFWRVRVGKFKTKQGAIGLAEKLGHEGYPVVLMRL